MKFGMGVLHLRQMLLLILEFSVNVHGQVQVQGQNRHTENFLTCSSLAVV